MATGARQEQEVATPTLQVRDIIMPCARRHVRPARRSQRARTRGAARQLETLSRTLGAPSRSTMGKKRHRLSKEASALALSCEDESGAKVQVWKRGAAEQSLRKSESGRVPYLAEPKLISGFTTDKVSRDNTRLLSAVDVQNFLLWAFHDSLGHMPKWICIRNKPLLRGLLVVLIPELDLGALQSIIRDAAPCDSLDPQLLRLPKSNEDRASQAAVSELLRVKVDPKKKDSAAASGICAEQHCEFSATGPAAASVTTVGAAGVAACSDGAGSSPSCSAAAMPSSAEDRTKLSNGRWRAAYVQSLALTKRELRDNGYSVDSTELEDDEEEDSGPGNSCTGHGEDAVSAKLLAIDCEMCLVGTEFQLARVAVVDEQMQVLLDELVVPERPVTDYNTRYSGITREMLASATTTQEEARAKVLSLVATASAAQTFLVGHSLENDLRALQISYSHVLDTAVLFPLRINPQGSPAKSSLRSLTAKYLRREIQQSERGHDPCEDAIAAMELALLKLRHGPTFAVPGASWGDSFAMLPSLLADVGCSSVGVRLDARLRLALGEAGVRNVEAATDEELVARVAGESGADKCAVWTSLQCLRRAKGKGAAARGTAVLQASELFRAMCSSVPANTLVLLIGTGNYSSTLSVQQADGGKRPLGCFSVGLTRTLESSDVDAIAANE